MTVPDPMLSTALRARHDTILASISPMRPASQRPWLRLQHLRPHLQPIARLADGTVVAHETLVRGTPDNPLQMPEQLFAAAREAQCVAAFEQTCLEAGLLAWTAQGAPGRLFANLSASTAVAWFGRADLDALSEQLRAAGAAPSSLVVEITEHEHASDIPALVEVADALRRHGVAFALDDFGDGRSSLRLWSELRPEFVKVDKYFVRGVDHEPLKVQTLRGLLHFAELFGTEVVAEGIETPAELQAVRDLGIEYGQGWLLGRPQEQARDALPAEALSIVHSRRIAVLPESSRAAGRHFAIGQLVEMAEPLTPETTVDDLAARFAADESLRAVALVDTENRPVGLVARQGFVDQYARPYFKEIYGRRPCRLFANGSPLLLDHNQGLDAATEVLTSADQRYLSEGFVVTQGGHYLGLGSGQRLVRSVTEARIEAARHANPLTFLPGNIPLSSHIARLLANGDEFVACYADLNDFKPFNDHYGYWRGDEMILLVARVLVEQADARHDFVGHVGGDDFVVLFQSTDWLARCERAEAAFRERSLALYDPAAVAAGGIEADDRHGVRRFFPLTRLAIGAARIPPGVFTQPEQVASAAAAAKHQAKQAAVPVVVTLAGAG